MAPKYRTKDGYSVEVIELSDTSGNHDGEWLRVRYHGYHVADVRSIAELERYFPLGELEADALVNAAWAARAAGGPCSAVPHNQQFGLSRTLLARSNWPLKKPCATRWAYWWSLPNVRPLVMLPNSHTHCPPTMACVQYG
jgi:hypothetical protein